MCLGTTQSSVRLYAAETREASNARKTFSVCSFNGCAPRAVKVNR